MKQQAHAWVALRALKLLDDWKKAPKLVELIFSYISEVWDGAWLPDIRIHLLITIPKEPLIIPL